jgi:endonuclease III related protein
MQMDRMLAELKHHLKDALTVFIFISRQDEPDTKPLIRFLFSEGVRVVVPRTLDDCSLELVELTRSTRLSPGKFGVMEPALGERISKQDVDLFIVPGTAFDLRGNRKGRGKGCFDRFLEDMVGKRRIIGLCKDHQLHKSLVPNPWDVPVDLVITESGRSACRDEPSVKVRAVTRRSWILDPSKPRSRPQETVGRTNIMKVYRKLLTLHGQQGWWPVIPRGGTAPKYGVRRHNSRQKLEIMISAILAQNTQWRPNVERAMIELNRKGLIDIDKMLLAKHDVLAQAIRSAGYYNQKAKKLKNLALFLRQHPIRELQRMEQWSARELLLSVKGIGPETADSILLYALDKPVFVVDAYTRRIALSLGFIKDGASYDEIQDLFMSSLPNDAKLYNEFHALLVEHAKRFYKKDRVRDLCPIAKTYGTTSSR